MNMQIRLQKHIADLGIASRRKAEELISDGKVKVNGKVITKQGTKVDPEKDKVKVDNKKSKIKNILPTNQTSTSKIYIALHKPVGYITSASSEQGKSVLDLIKKENGTGIMRRDVHERIYPVGRLDKDSEGLILLTNDGDLTNKLTHPRYEHEKEYEISLDKPLSRDAKKVLEKGMSIGDEFVQGIKIKKQIKKGRQTSITAVLKEGKNRQIRRMFGRLGYDVKSLKRTRIVKLRLGVIPVGRWRFVKKDAIV